MPLMDMYFADICMVDETTPSPPSSDIDLEAAVGEGVESRYDGPRSCVPIEEICNGEWSIGGSNLQFLA